MLLEVIWNFAFIRVTLPHPEIPSQAIKERSYVHSVLFH